MIDEYKNLLNYLWNGNVSLMEYIVNFNCLLCAGNGYGCFYKVKIMTMAVKARER